MTTAICGMPARRHVGLVVEDAAEMLAVGKHLVLVRQVGAAGIDQVDAGQPVLRARSPARAGASSPSSGSRCRPSPWRRWRRSCTRCPATRPMPVMMPAARHLAAVHAVRRELRRARGTASRDRAAARCGRAAAACRARGAARAPPRRRPALTASATCAADRRPAPASPRRWRETRRDARVDERISAHGIAQTVSSNSSRPISMRRISLVPAPIS